MEVCTKTDLRNQVMYSIYVRNYSEEGTFQMVEKDLDRIQNLGVDIIWLMPIHPVGQKARKGTLGSPYAIFDYRKINPEFGTIDDFISLANAIHARGMKCIIDVVYNHTAPDSWLAQNHPEFFYQTPEGTMGNRVGDWTDIIDLDYGNKDLWDYQIETLKMWAQIVDGFRCDVAPLVPLEFWQKAREEVTKVNPECFWLSESVEPNFIIELRSRGMTGLSDSEIFQAFDSCYDYDVYGYFCKYLRGEIPLSVYVERVNMQEYIYPENYVKLRYLENHDQSRVKAIVNSQEALMNWTAFLYFQKGMTLIYAGQEMENDITPSLFDKDTVSWNTGYDISDYLKTLYKLKKHPIFTDSSYYLKAYDHEEIIVGTHKSGDKKMVGVFNLKGNWAAVDVDLEDGMYYDLLNQEPVAVQYGKVHSKGYPIIIESR